jgi:hypothetical protein
MPESMRKLEAYDGTEVAVKPIKPLANGGTRVDISAEDGPKWRLNITRAGNITVVTTWNADGELADVEVPDWMDDIVARLQRA